MKRRKKRKRLQAAKIGLCPGNWENKHTINIIISGTSSVHINNLVNIGVALYCISAMLSDERSAACSALVATGK